MSLDPTQALDPVIAGIAAQVAAAGAPPLSSFTPEIARQGMQAAFAAIDGKRRASVTVRDLTVPVADGSALEARLYTPKDASGAMPLIVYFHQGGCVLGGVWTPDTWCSILAEEANIAVLNVDYRHAPEHKFPASVEDAIGAYDWAKAHAKELGADPNRIGVGGDSAGGYLATTICHHLKRQGKPQPVVQLMIYPAVDWTARHGSFETMKDAYPLNSATMFWFADLYFNHPDEAKDWRASPALQDDVAGLAPALVYNGAYDPLTTQGEEYAAKLKAAGVPTKHHTYPTLSHSFTAMTGAVPAAAAALSEIAADVKKAFAS